MFSFFKEERTGATVGVKTEMILTYFPLGVLREYLPTGHLDGEIWDAIKSLPVSQWLPH